MIHLPKTRDEKIDAIHQEELTLLEKFLKVLENGTDEEIKEIFSAFIEHMKMHFDHEESLMESLDYYSMGELHKGEHYKVLSEASYKLMNWNNFKDRDEIKEYLQEDFIHWLKQHIDAMDLGLVEQIRREKKR